MASPNQPFYSPSFTTIPLFSPPPSPLSSSQASTSSLADFDLTTRLTALSTLTATLLSPNRRHTLFTSTSTLPVITHTFAWAGLHLSPHTETSTYSFRLRPGTHLNTPIARCPGTGRWLFVSPLEPLEEEKEVKFRVKELVDQLGKLAGEMIEGWDECEWKGMVLGMTLGSEWEEERVVLAEEISERQEEDEDEEEEHIDEGEKETEEEQDQDEEWEVVTGKKLALSRGFLLV